MNLSFRCKAEQTIANEMHKRSLHIRTFRIYSNRQKYTLCICLLIHWIWQNLCSFAAKAFLVCVCVSLSFSVCVCWFENNIGGCYCYNENKIVQLAKWVICQSVCRESVSKMWDSTAHWTRLSSGMYLCVCVCARSLVHSNTWRINRKEICK